MSVASGTSNAPPPVDIEARLRDELSDAFRQLNAERAILLDMVKMMRAMTDVLQASVPHLPSAYARRLATEMVEGARAACDAASWPTNGS